MNKIKVYNKFRILMALIRRRDWQYIKMRSSFYFSSTSIYGRIVGIEYNSLNRRKGVLLGPVTVAPNGSRWFGITGIKSEKIRITISHSDSFIKKNRKSIIVEIDCRMKGNKGAARSMGLNFNGKNAFQYMGGGHVREGIFQQVADIRIPANMSELRFRIRPLVDRYVNIDDLKISLDETVGLTKERPPQIDLDRIDVERLAAARAMVVANIDLNVVDGSSVWLSSMASILCSQGPAILVSKTDLKSDVVTSNIRNAHNLLLIQPKDVGLENQNLSVGQLIGVARSIDGYAAQLTTVVCRGLEAAAMLLSDRQFMGRVDAYLTDFYYHEGDKIIVPPENVTVIDTVSRQARRMLVQTAEIGQKLKETTSVGVEFYELPPAVLDNAPPRASPRQIGTPVRIGYSGKIAPQWGIIELLDWVEALRCENIDVKLTVIGNKISGFADPRENRRFRTEILRRFQDLDVNYVPGVNRETVNSIMLKQDFSWCWRPSYFEDATLEISTKLVEGLSSGLACIAYPSRINQRLCGKDYPFFVRSRADFEKLISQKTICVPSETVREIRARHDINKIASAFNSSLPAQARANLPVVTVSCHDFKFIDPYLAHLRARGIQLFRDPWNWGRPKDLNASKMLQSKADIVFAEWGLANAVWHSKTLPPGKRLIIRIHLQEINARAAHFGYELNHDRVDLFIFVSERVREEAIKMFGWVREKTVVIPNFVLGNEYKFIERSPSGKVKLGMVGIIPQRKRFDRGIDILEGLLNLGIDAELHIKGPRPEDLEYMHAPGRREELSFYRNQYDRIENNMVMRGRVVFHSWGNDVAGFYKDVDYILSPSDFESFHYALADGVLSGCYPLVWPWEEASDIYTPDWIVSSGQDAIDAIVLHRKMDKKSQDDLRKKNRNLVISKYGHEAVFRCIDECIGVS